MDIQEYLSTFFGLHTMLKYVHLTIDDGECFCFLWILLAKTSSVHH
jgi:hypothetical protein